MGSDTAGTWVLGGLRRLARIYIAGLVAYGCAFYGCPLETMLDWEAREGAADATAATKAACPETIDQR